ncbi:TolC family protein [Sulfurimonas sp. HSL3-7]|uniref:TolC family protein n=1 Tax=Sulfonitrofixus jiaomeiensis TaxID=3131938 RepID=UPI0031F76EB8
MRMISSLLAITLSLYGAALPGEHDLTLDEAIEILKEDNLDIKAAQYELQSTQAKTAQASAMNWGTLDLILNASNSDDAGNVFGFKLTSRQATFGDFGFADFDMTNPDILTVKPEDLNNPGSTNFYQTKLEYTLPIYAGGKISGYTDISRFMEKMQGLEKDKTVNDKIYETRKAFYDMGLLEQAIKNLTTINENIARLENTTHYMIKEGYAKRIDLLEVQAKRSNVERKLHEMKANEDLLYHYLSFLLNREVKQIKVPESEVKASAFSTEEILNRNVDIKKAETGLQIRRRMVDVSHSGYLPMVGLKADVQSSAIDLDNYDMIDNGSYTAGVQLKWNLFSGGSDANKVQEAKVNALKTKTQVELAKKGIALQVDKIRTEIESLDYEIESLSKELELSTEIYKSYEERYREQLASMNDLIIKQSEQIEKVLTLLEVKNKRNERVFALEKLANGEQ